ncbi:hypothetical protein R0J87_19210, partial [Halomonas sp. SIMBA_159]
MFVRDINNDGVGDAVYHAGYSRNRKGNVDPYLTGEMRVFLSDGTKFVGPNTVAAGNVANYSTLGDFDGDGALDFAEAGAS